MKKLIVPVVISLVAILLYAVTTRIDYGALTITLIEHTAHVDIVYEKIDGSLFRGYIIENYTVRMSENDSIYGDIADISYRFKPLNFRLPNLFEVNLLAPTIYLKQETESAETQKRTPFTLPQLNIGLRISMKNGTVIYENREERIHTVEAISGLLFVDILASKVFINTMNLSFTSPDYPVRITSANLDIRLDNKGITTPSFRIKGNGIDLRGSGSYSFEKQVGTLNIAAAALDLATFHLHTGSVDFSGEIIYQDKKVLPRIKGSVIGFKPIERFGFETNVLADTILVNVFDGELWDGSFFAVAKIADSEHWGFEANCTSLDLGKILNTKIPLLVSGYLVYRGNNFSGLFTSPEQYGLGIDSLKLSGVVKGSEIILDSLIVLDPDTVIIVHGLVYPTLDFSAVFREFNVGTLSQFTPVEGALNGTCHVRGDARRPIEMSYTSQLTAHDFVIYNIHAETLMISSTDVRVSDKTGTLQCRILTPRFGSIQLDSMDFVLDNRTVTIDARRANDSIHIVSAFDRNWQGTISPLNIVYNGVITHSNEPITFDIEKQQIGEIEMSFVGGTLTGTLFPLSIRLDDGDLTQLGTLVGSKDTLRGNLHVTVDNDSFTITATAVDYLDIRNGVLTVTGVLSDGSIALDSLTLTDDNNQDLFMYGKLSPRYSDVTAQFSSLGTWMLPFLAKSLIEPHGLMTGQIRFQGNVEEFAFSGGGMIEEGTFGIGLIAAQIESLSSRVTFDKNRILFTDARGKISTMGKRMTEENTSELQAGGYLELEPRFGMENFNIDVSFRDAPLQYPPFVYGIGSGNFSVGARKRINYYNGNITAKQAIVPIEFGVQFIQEEEGAPENWTMNLKIRGENNIWLRNSDADIEFGGEIYFVKQNAPLYISGELATHRGYYYWLNHVLDITEGTVVFLPQEEIDAELDFWAQLDTPEGVTVKLHLFGLMSEPIFEFFSDPPDYSEQDIVTYLNLNVTWRELESIQQGDYVGRVLPHTLISWLEGDVSRRIRQRTGLDYFRIETPFFEPESKTKLTVGKYISKDLFVTYTYDVTSFADEFNVEYYIDDKNQVVIQKNEEEQYSLQYQYRIRF
jgi:hypothetical protein